jgi:hypothetical protein
MDRRKKGDFRRQVLVQSYSTARALEFDRLCWGWIRSISLELGKQSLDSMINMSSYDF